MKTTILIVIGILGVMFQVDVKNGKAIIQAATPYSYGHMTMAHPELWADQVQQFWRFINRAE